MSTPDPDEASPSPEYSGDDMAAEQTADRPDGDASPDNKTANAKANAKDPLRPRRKKARRACFACQRAHLTCGKFVFLCSSTFVVIKMEISTYHGLED
jgi:hypothetical protein